MWEEAIILGKELAEQYENEMFDFEQLSASLVSNIIFVFNVINVVILVRDSTMINLEHIPWFFFKREKEDTDLFIYLTRKASMRLKSLFQDRQKQHKWDVTTSELNKSTFIKFENKITNKGYTEEKV